MKEDEKNICPTCQGKKIIAGVCECDSEWRGTDGEDGLEECQCTPEQDCPTCHGKGVSEPG